MKITGFKVGAIEVQVDDNNGKSLAQILKENGVSFQGNTVLLDGEAIPASAVGTTVPSASAQRVEVTPAAKGGK
jgi:hypothetical protein